MCEKFCEFHGFGAIRKSFNFENSHSVRGRVTINGRVNNNGRKLPHSQMVVFYNFVKFYLQKSDFLAICESFHPQKIPAIRYLDCCLCL